MMNMHLLKNNAYTPFVSEQEWKKSYPEVDREYIWTYPLIHGPNPFNPKRIFMPPSVPIISNDLVIYIHLPACLFRCPMCPFYVELVNSRDDLKTYADSIIKELKLYAFMGVLDKYNLKAIYFGGGTATLFYPQDIARIIKTIKELSHADDTIEITVEGHPCTVDYDYLSTIYDAGVNRVSFGIQSFQDETLKILGLRQTEDDNRRVLKDALKVGFQTVSADMLYRTPNQTVKTCREELKKFFDIGIHSLSAYSLELSVREGYLQKLQPDEEEDIKMFYAINDEMSTRKWFHTAQPDYSHPDHVSKETIVTWRAPQGHTLGLGAGACSSLNGNTFFNVHDMEEYNNVIAENCLPILTGQTFTLDDAITRYIVLGIRCFVINRKVFFKHFGKDIVDLFSKELIYLQENGLIQIDEQNILVTRKGKYYVDNISKIFYSKENRCHLQPWGEKMKGAVAGAYLKIK